MPTALLEDPLEDDAVLLSVRVISRGYNQFGKEAVRDDREI